VADASEDQIDIASLVVERNGRVDLTLDIGVVDDRRSTDRRNDHAEIHLLA
jgi:hypothetical protein